ncbi:cyclic nucleotide-binding domain-containing protein [Pedobacter sp. SD-b]|uniref:Cyclic nucleotide-binding domain-containing protein n=1 Tax=Pedobacter segetis TaxID=2793069 RepID=A0ABS1BLV0_9SPHI|nr:cyclic nucleotide-binding domain-containing protein [Pedobacter segetis]
MAEKALFSEQEFELIKSLSKEINYKKGTKVLQEGKICKQTIFVCKGLLRLYRLDANGKEYTLKFAHENRWMSDRESYINASPSFFNIDAIESSNVLIWQKENFAFLLGEIPAFKMLMENLSSKSLIWDK